MDRDHLVNAAPIDKASRQYWDAVWRTEDLPPSVEPRADGLRNHVIRRWDAYFREVFAASGLRTQGATLLEIGCAQSVWLPYFHREFGFAVHGLDYSGLGCQRARAVLDRERVSGAIHCADLFSAPKELKRRFDVVASFGVAEHFADTASCFAAMASLVRPGGLLITTVPNITGLVGWLTWLLNRPVYNVHVPLDRERLRAAAGAAGLEVTSCSYLLFSNLGVVNIESMRLQRPRLWWTLNKIRAAADKAAFLIERAFPKLARPNSVTSPYIQCVAVVDRAVASETAR